MDTKTMSYYYQNGLWTLEQLDNLLKVGKITKEQRKEITMEENGTGPTITPEAVIAAMSEACASAITGGVDVALSDGQAYHFSLTLEDQMNLMSLQAMVNAGAEAVPYHADGEDCRYYTAADFNLIAQAATAWKMYQESYFNSLRGYIQSIENEDELEAVQYGMDIPEIFQTDVLRRLTEEVQP